MASASSEHTADTPVESDFDQLDVEDEPALFTITVTLHGNAVDLPFHNEDATIQDLSDLVAEDLHIPPTNQKFLTKSKFGLLKPPFKDPTLQLRQFQETKIVLMGATTAEVEELESDMRRKYKTRPDIPFTPFDLCHIYLTPRRVSGFLSVFAMMLVLKQVCASTASR